MIAVESTQTVFRLASVADMEVVIEAFAAYLIAVDNFGHDVLPTEDNARTYWRDVFAPAINENRSYVILAEQEGQIIGALFWVIPCKFVELREPSAVDIGAWVDVDHRCNGVATSMRNFAVELLLERGIKTVVSTILKDNVAGLESYKKVGGKITGYMVEIPIMKGEV